MNLKKLEKAAKIYELIKLVDAQIIEIEKLAIIVSNGEIMIFFPIKN